MRKFLVFGIPALVAFGVGLYRVATVRPKEGEYSAKWVASRAFAANHQVQQDDLRVPGGIDAVVRLLLEDESLNGAHVKGAAHPAGAVLRDADFDRRPDLSKPMPHAQIYFYVTKEDSTPIGGWTEGASIVPCYLKTEGKAPATKQRAICIHTPLRILAIHKAQNTNEASWLAIEVPEKFRCTFAEFAMADKRTLYQVNPP
jgi:hypothetical protein